VTAFGLAVGIVLVGALIAAMLPSREDQQRPKLSTPPADATTPAGTARAWLPTPAR
jgi:hypothetical protein